MRSARSVAWAISTLAFALWSCVMPAATAAHAASARAAPPFPSRSQKDWVGPPVSWETLRGQAVLLHVWTFGCGNCVRTLPWYRAVDVRYGPRGLRLIGVHTPEFAHEREKEDIRRHAEEHGLSWPHLLDADYGYWKALGNQYWPSTYLADRCGRLRERRIGEVHENEESGRRLQARIEELLAGRIPGELFFRANGVVTPRRFERGGCPSGLRRLVAERLRRALSVERRHSNREA